MTLLRLVEGSGSSQDPVSLKKLIVDPAKGSALCKRLHLACEVSPRLLELDDQIVIKISEYPKSG